jgi:hypothetical protein
MRGLYLTFFILIGSSFGQRADFTGIVNDNTYLYYHQPFSAGVKKIDFNLEILNGRAAIQIMSEDNFALKTGGKNYKYYPVISDRPFKSLHETVEYYNFRENFYILLIPYSFDEPLSVKGYVEVLELQYKTADKSWVIALSISITLCCLLILVLFTVHIYKMCCERKQIIYVNALPAKIKNDL